MHLKSFNTIGIGIAFSPNLKANICEASRLALFFQSKLVLIHVGEESDEKISTLKSFLQPFLKAKIDFKIVFKTGDPVDVILSTSIDQRIDLLILGALQRENILNYYMGSIARKITRKAKCSVLLLIKPSEQSFPCNHIVVNGLKDPKTKETISTAFYVGHQLGTKKMTIVEEISQEEVSVKVEDDKSLRKANLVKERLKLREESRVKEIITQIPDDFKRDISIKTQPIFGKRGYSIGHYAQLARADLLVMNSPSKLNFWDRLFPHDIEYILTELPTDVLIVR
ncbi:MAG: universal stress protein [Flavobacteriaceae bacterium]|nr:universal stress protein [Flavobacteriaceae bacterium]